MDQSINYIIKDFKGDLKRRRYREVVHKIEKMIRQQNQHLDSYNPSSIIKLLHMQTFACYKIFIRELVCDPDLQQPQKQSSHQKKGKIHKTLKRKIALENDNLLNYCVLKNLMSLMYRNFKYGYLIVNRVISSKVMLMKLLHMNDIQANGLNPLPDSKLIDTQISKSDLNRLFEIAIWVTYDTILLQQYYTKGAANSEKPNQTELSLITLKNQWKINILEVSLNFINSIKEHGYGPNTSKRLLQEIQIRQLYAYNLNKLSMYNESQKESNTSMLMMLSTLASLNHKQSSVLQSRKIKNLKKKCGKLIFINFMFLLCGHVSKGQVSYCKSILYMIKNLSGIPGVKLFYNKFTIFPTIIRFCQQVADEYQDLRFIVNEEIFDSAKLRRQISLMTNFQIQHAKTQYRKSWDQKKKTTILSNNDAFEDTHTQDQEVSKPFHRQKRKLRTCLDQDKKKIKCKGFRSIYFSAQTRKLGFIPVLDSKQIIDENQDQSIAESQSYVDRNSKSTLPKSLLQNKSTKKKKQLFSDGQIVRHKEKLKLRKELLHRNTKFSSQNISKVQMIGPDLIPLTAKHSIRIFHPQVQSNPPPNNPDHKEKAMNQSNKKMIKRLGYRSQKLNLIANHQNGQEILVKFLKILLKNKKTLKIPEYGGRIGNYLDKLQFEGILEQNKNLNELGNKGLLQSNRKRNKNSFKINLDERNLLIKTSASCSQTSKSSKRNRRDLQFNQNFAVSLKSYESATTLHQKSQQEMSMTDPHKKSNPYLLSIQNIDNEDYQRTQSNICTHEPAPQQTNKLLNCYRMSAESINNLIKKLDAPQNMTLKRKPNNLSMLRKHKFDNRYSLV